MKCVKIIRPKDFLPIPKKISTQVKVGAAVGAVIGGVVGRSVEGAFVGALVGYGVGKCLEPRKIEDIIIN